MTFFNICHDYAHYDIIWDGGLHTCSKCGREFQAVLADWSKGDYETTWEETLRSRIKGWIFRVPKS